jgi:hypothetical protein
MKKILPVFLVLTVIFTFAGCSNILGNSENGSSEKDAKSNSMDEQSKSKTDSKKEATPVKKMINMNIEVENQLFTAILENNDTAKAFVKQMPLIVDMSELNGNEKYNYLSSNIRVDASSCQGIINEGDLMLYGDNCIVLFYKAHSTSYSYVKIGHIDNVTGLAKAVGKGNVKVTFSISE